MVGRTLSHFRILARIGEGGMGVVYKAEDQRLHRTVAVKVLAAEAVADDERRLRFFREARAAASLAHPCIATIYEVDEADGIIFIAMEHIEGKPLRALVASGRLSVTEALIIAIDVSEGLSRAHQNRVIHRDLKPENIMVTPEGHAKILDFGLAKLLESEALPSEASLLDTISGEMTQQGRVMGTAAYMSPEQARGQRVDNRSDLFAFGIVLYEMLTGRAPFRESTPLDTLTAVLRVHPAPASELNVSLRGEPQRDIVSRGSKLQWVTWSADDAFLYATDFSNKSRILLVDLDGGSLTLLDSQQPGDWMGRLFVSPDGRHLGFGTRTFVTGYWSLESY